MPGSFQNQCNAVSTDPALLYVGAGYAQFTQYAAQSFALANSQVDLLNNFNIDYITWNAQFDADGVLGGFRRPERPNMPDIVVPDMTLVLPVAPNINVQPIVLETAPAEPADLLTPPSFNIPAAPAEFNVVAPGAAPVMAEIEAPLPPTLAELLPPELLALVLPAAPNITVPSFDVLPPEFNAPVPDSTLDFTERLYASVFVDQIKAKLANWILTDGRVPAALSNAIWGAAISRDDAGALKMYQEARDQFGSKGWDEPTGVLAARLREAQQTNRDKRAQITRDVYIQEETLAIENLKFAIQQGLQLETTYMQAWLTIEQRRFDLIVKAKDVALAVFAAYVQQFNAAVSAYNAQIEGYKAELTTLQTLVQLYVAQIEGVKVLSDINERSVRAYAAQIQAQAAYADLYRSQIEGFKARIDGERARIDGYRSEVEAYSSRVGAYGEEWKAYNSRLEAEVQKGAIYGTMVDAYGKRIDVWRTKSQVAIEDQKGDLAVVEMQLKGYDSQTRVAIAKLEGARINVDAQIARNASLSEVYKTDSAVESTAVDADTRIFSAQTERERAKIELLLKDAEMQMTQLLQRSGLLLEAYKSAGASSSQLAASSFSAMNFSAGISSSSGKSESCSTNFSFSGEILES